ncbi:hypothetical protein BDR07DRAFT_309728 [Suillus spraguei]|nr:hypothetical protein BDR07DRAFT_309728 [Suillus spraguei]
MVRERALQKAAEDGCRSPTSASAGDEDVKRFICEIFDISNATRASTTEPLRGAAGSHVDGVNGTREDSVPTLQNPAPGGRKKMPTQMAPPMQMVSTEREGRLPRSRCATFFDTELLSSIHNMIIRSGIRICPRNRKRSHQILSCI